MEEELIQGLISIFFVMCKFTAKKIAGIRATTASGTVDIRV